MAAPSTTEGYLAIQQDAAAISVDWQGFTPDHPAGRFHGAVFVVDESGAYFTHLALADSTDQTADTCLSQGGWRRTEEWRADEYGRRVAAVRSAGPVAGRAPEEVFASIQRSIDVANEHLGQLPSAAFYRKPAPPG